MGIGFHPELSLGQHDVSWIGEIYGEDLDLADIQWTCEVSDLDVIARYRKSGPRPAKPRLSDKSDKTDKSFDSDKAPSLSHTISTIDTDGDDMDFSHALGPVPPASASDPPSAAASARITHVPTRPFSLQDSIPEYPDRFAYHGDIQYGDLMDDDSGSDPHDSDSLHLHCEPRRPQQTPRQPSQPQLQRKRLAMSPRTVIRIAAETNQPLPGAGPGNVTGSQQRISSYPGASTVEPRRRRQPSAQITLTDDLISGRLWDGYLGKLKLQPENHSRDDDGDRNGHDGDRQDEESETGEEEIDVVVKICSLAHREEGQEEGVMAAMSIKKEVKLLTGPLVPLQKLGIVPRFYGLWTGVYKGRTVYMMVMEDGGPPVHPQNVKKDQADSM